MKKFFVKRWLPLCLGVIAALNMFAATIEVNRNELESTDSSAVEFESFGGPWQVIETADAIRGIGGNLGSIIARNIAEASVAGSGEKYTLIHAVGDSQEGVQKFSADILVINENAGVDHIKNLRRIISGYLENAYGYSREDADALAVFITVYNAVYRGQIETFSAKYTDSVLRNLEQAKVGLSTNWQDWAGKSQIVIPLGEYSGMATVETSVISDEKVIDVLKQDEDKNIEAREKLADIKERESQSASQNAIKAQREATEQRQQGNKEGAAQSAQKATQQQQVADRKSNEARTERADIQKDNEIIAEQKPVETITGLFVEDEKKGFFRLITVESDSGKIVRRSPITQIRSKAVYTVNDISVLNDENQTEKFAQMYLAVCGTNDKRSAVRLCLIDPDTLEIKKQSEEILSGVSELIQNGNNFIAVIQDEKNYKAAIYDKNLTLIAKSDVTVKETTPLNITKKGLLVTSQSGSPVLLDETKLKEVWGQGKTKVHQNDGLAK